MGFSLLCGLCQISRVLNITFSHFQKAGLDFLEAAHEQGPSGGQTMTQEPTATTNQPLLDDKSSQEPR